MNFYSALKFRSAIACGLTTLLLVSHFSNASALQQNNIAGHNNLDNQKVLLGQVLFNDANLSEPAGHACSSCHRDTSAFVDNQEVSFGMFQQQGTRNSSTIMYLKYNPPFSYSNDKNTWVGGQFWDGRANTFQEQARGPLFNPIEMNNTPEGLATKLRTSEHFVALGKLYGQEQVKSNEGLINAVLDALAQFQSSDAFAPFSAKYDYFIAGKTELTAQELTGKKIFEGKGRCTDCHAGEFEGKQLFTSFAHHNILVPKNPRLPVYYENKNFIDEGTAHHPALTKPEIEKARGRFKTPTLRNVAITQPYMHNGFTYELKEAIQLHLTFKDRKKWGPAEVAQNQSPLLMENVSFDEQELDAVVAFLKTLTDGYVMPTQNEATSNN